MLDADERRRYARHAMLAEIGERGLEQLCAHAVEPTGDARAGAVARTYLERSGVRTGSGGVLCVAVPSAPAGLEEAAAFVAGAFAAVEEIKRTVGAGAPGALPERLF